VTIGSPTRYRIEAGKTCIDIRLRTAQQLFDGRDPAPFRERDLDEEAVLYLVTALQELPPKAAVQIVFWISEERTPQVPVETIVDAVRGHFTYEGERLDRLLRQHVRRGQLFLLFGLTALVLFLSLAELTLMLPAGHVRQILREGLVIIGWVAMWRPLEALLYDWWPLVQERRLARRLLGVPVTVHYEPGPGPSAATAA
jgi:hypothetical protein